jgi:hypothetical protein
MPAELVRRFERPSRTYEARALPTELHQHKRWKFKFGAEYGNCTRVSGLAIRSTAPVRTPRGASSESRTRVIGAETRGTSRYTMLALRKTWRS